MDSAFECPDRTRLISLQQDEVIFRENPSRWVLLPVEYPTIFKFYKALENQYWTPSPLIWNYDEMRKSISIPGDDGMTVVYCVLVDMKLLKGFPSDAKIDTTVYADVLDQICEITDFVQSPEARAFLGFENMLEDFHREAINCAISAVLRREASTPSALLDSKVCLPHVRHTYSIAHWIKCHLSDMALYSRRLAGDVADYIPDSQTPPPCLAEVLVTLAISKGIFGVMAPGILLKWVLSNNKNALAQLFSHIVQDLCLFEDFYSHLYHNLLHKLLPESLFRMVTDAIVLSHQYALCVFQPLISSKHLKSELIDCYIKDLGLRVVKACGELPAEFQSYYLRHEQSRTEHLQQVCWPLMENFRNSECSLLNVPFHVFGPLQGDWVTNPIEVPPITAFSINDEGYYNPSTIESEGNDIGHTAPTTAAPTSNSLYFDDDF